MMLLLHNERARGFTLIEMSIVLVIIGLIVGGILKGQELIESSRQKNLASTIDRIKANTTTFVEKYGALPGDYNEATVRIDDTANAVDDGDANGVVDQADDGPAANVAALIAIAVADASTEEREFFNHMIAADLFGGRQTPANEAVAAGDRCGEDLPNPAAPFPQSCIGVNYGIHEGDGAGGGTTAHWIHVFPGPNGTATEPNTGGAATSTGVISPKQAFFYDTKFDDGIATLGEVRTQIVGDGCGDAGAANSDYDSTIDQVNCRLVIRGDF